MKQNKKKQSEMDRNEAKQKKKQSETGPYEAKEKETIRNVPKEAK